VFGGIKRLREWVESRGEDDTEDVAAD
jgi:hypothetical protein